MLRELGGDQPGQGFSGRFGDPVVHLEHGGRLGGDLQVGGTELPAGADNLDQPLTPYGHPLSATGVIKLKIAFAIAARPRILVLPPLFDMLSQEARQRIVRHLGGAAGLTVLCFSHRRDLPLFDDYLLCDFHRQSRYTSSAALFAAYDRAVGGAERQA